MREAGIIDAVRSPRGRGTPGVGSLSHIHPQRCMAQVLNGLRDKVGCDPADIEDVVAGCGTGSGDHAHDIARMSVRCAPERLQRCDSDQSTRPQ